MLQKGVPGHTALEKQSFLDLSCEGKCFAPCIFSVAPAAQEKSVVEGPGVSEIEFSRGSRVPWEPSKCFKNDQHIFVEPGAVAPGAFFQVRVDQFCRKGCRRIQL